MERRYRASNAIFIYAGLLIVTALLLIYEAVQRLRAEAIIWAVVLGLLGVIWLVVAGVLLYSCGRLLVHVRVDQIAMSGGGPEQRLYWAEIVRVREYRGPAYQLSLRSLLPGPYLPLGLLRGEAVLEITAESGIRLLFRQSLVENYGSLRQEILSSVPRDTDVDLHARWWRTDEWARRTALPAQKDKVAGGGVRT